MLPYEVKDFRDELVDSYDGLTQFRVLLLPALDLIQGILVEVVTARIVLQVA